MGLIEVLSKPSAETASSRIRSQRAAVTDLPLRRPVSNHNRDGTVPIGSESSRPVNGKLLQPKGYSEYSHGLRSRMPGAPKRVPKKT